MKGLQVMMTEPKKSDDVPPEPTAVEPVVAIDARDVLAPVVSADVLTSDIPSLDDKGDDAAMEDV